MQYFTPDLWLRMQSGVDRQTFLAAYDEWERRINAYTEEVSRIIPKTRDHLHLRRFALQVSLHDAVVRECWFATQYRLNLLVQPEPSAERLVLLEYLLVGEGTVVNRNVLPPEFCTPQVTWMYDEFAVLSTPDAVDEPVFTHNILLGTGFELIICFRKLKVSRHHALRLGPEQNVPQPAASLPRTA